VGVTVAPTSQRVGVTVSPTSQLVATIDFPTALLLPAALLHSRFAGAAAAVPLP
jgi:hypothetical protein